MSEYVKFTNGSFQYSVTDGNVIVSKIKYNGDIKSEIINCSVPDLEILYYSPENKHSSTSIVIVAPDMDMSHQCIVNKDIEHNLSKFYSQLIEQGAVVRKMNSFKAVFSKHSVTAQKQKEIKDAEKRSKRADKALAHSNEILLKKKRAGCKEKTEEQYTCARCGNIWYITETDKMKNTANAMIGTVYSLNQVKEHNKCTKCGSTASTHKTVKIWVDSKGNVKDFEE